jgi:RHS repeat-associated protein
VFDNQAGKWKETTINALGDPVSVKENQNNNLITTYSYNSSGQVKQVNSAGTIITTTYDIYGKPETVINPNSGTTSYSYNAYGEITSYTDARSGNFQYIYDKLGRIDSIIRPSPDGLVKYTYYSSGGGIGQVQKVETSGVSYNYSYDQYGRISTFNENISGEQNLTSSFTYDSNGNTSSMTYPGGFVANYVYSNGYLKEIRKGDNSLIWRLDSINGFSQPKKYSLGPGSLFTRCYYDTLGFLTKKITGNFEQYFSFNVPTGNLMSRRNKYPLPDTTFDKTESFTYDNLDRLITAQISGGTQKAVTYADNGNILSRTGIGTYSYDPASINAVTEINPFGQDFIPNNQDITYTSFNKVLTIADTVLTDPYTMSMTYGPDRQRVKRVQTKNGAVQKTKYYSLQYEKEITGGSTIEINYISSPYGLVAVNRKVNSADTTFYVGTDHLGSIMALFDSGGNVKEKFSYDAWGRRRNPSDWTYFNVPNPIRLERGFTGHEHYEIFKLIDMNGRVYDPVIGRFLSPDPFIQSPDFTQSYNSYSYCLNNPLKFSDPSGYIPIPQEEEVESYQTIMNPGEDPWLNPAYYTIENLMWRNSLEILVSIQKQPKKGGSSFNEEEGYVIVYDKSGKPVKIPLSVIKKYNPSFFQDDNKKNSPAVEIIVIPYLSIVALYGEDAAAIKRVYKTSNDEYFKLIDKKGSQFLNNLSKGFAYFLAGSSITLDMIYSFKGQQSWIETFANTGVTGAALYIGGWPGLILETTFQAGKSYTKLIMQHPDWVADPSWFGR